MVVSMSALGKVLHVQGSYGTMHDHECCFEHRRRQGMAELNLGYTDYVYSIILVDPLLCSMLPLLVRGAHRDFLHFPRCGDMELLNNTPSTLEAVLWEMDAE